MRLIAPATGTEVSVSVCLREHASLLDQAPIAGLSEDEIIDLVRANQRVIRRLEGVGSDRCGPFGRIGWPVS